MPLIRSRRSEMKATLMDMDMTWWWMIRRKAWKSWRKCSKKNGAGSADVRLRLFFFSFPGDRGMFFMDLRYVNYLMWGAGFSGGALAGLGVFCKCI